MGLYRGNESCEDLKGKADDQKGLLSLPFIPFVPFPSCTDQLLKPP